MNERIVLEIFAKLAALLVEQKPSDPIDFLLGLLEFPFSNDVPVAFRDPSACLSCQSTTVEYRYGIRDSCCVYELRGAFGKADSVERQICNFLNSNENLMVVVGSAENFLTQRECDCFGSGKSRLCRWLDVPGRWLHQRKVIFVDNSSSAALVGLLESVGDFQHKLTELLNEDEPTLTLVDHIEPPHSILHALLQHHYFRSERKLLCRYCQSQTLLSRHKSILFTRPGVLFKFPIPCRMFSISRKCRVGAGSSKPQGIISSVSYGALVGPAHVAKKSRVRFDVEFADHADQFHTAQTFVRHYDEIYLQSHPYLSSMLENLKNTPRPLLDFCQEFKQNVQSRCRLEYLLAQFVVKNNSEVKFDISEFNDFASFLVREPAADVYIARQLIEIFVSRRSRRSIGNLLCFVAASQQQLSPFPPLVSITEILELYLGDIGDDKPDEIMETLSLQNLVLGNLSCDPQKSLSVARTLLDVRGTLLNYELLTTLLKGTSQTSSQKRSTPASSTSLNDSPMERQCSRILSESGDTRCYGHPVLLITDVTDVGRHGFEGHGLVNHRKNVSAIPSHCFFASPDNQGLSLVVTVERHAVVARSTFALADSSDGSGEQVYWQLRFVNGNSIVDATQSNDVLLILLSEGSAICIKLNFMERGISIQVVDSSFNDTHIERSGMKLVIEGSDDAERNVDTTLIIVHQRHLECSDPKVGTSSKNWIAAASHDSDIVGAHSFDADGPHSLVIQTEDNVSCISLIGSVLIAGLETGAIQGFALPEGRELFSIEHHEAQINVIKSLPGTFDSDYFIVGSEDFTLTVFRVDDTDPVKSLRGHSSPVIDIVATQSVVVSADKAGCLIAWSLDLSSPKSTTILWSATFVGVRSMGLSHDGSWLACARSQNSPIAFPISEWIRDGTGRVHQKPITSVHVTADEMYLLTGGEDGLIFVWDLSNNLRFLCSFQQHPINSTINSISTSSDNEKVVSADAANLICLWKLQSGSILRILQRGSGGGLARFIQNDFLLVQTKRGVKVFDNSERLFSSTTFGDVGSIDVIFVPDEIFGDCREFRQKGDDPDGNVDELSHSVNPDHDRLRNQCFVGMTKGNEDSGVHSVSIASLGDLNTCRFELLQGEVEDEFGDEEELSHSDRITCFSFLQPRKFGLVSTDPDDCDPPPTLLLAVSGAEDLTAIVWNWPRRQPLKLLQHTSFVTGCLFWSPSLGPRDQYAAETLRFMSSIDPSFRACKDKTVVCNLVTAQYADSNKVSLRVFQLRENPRAFQRRILQQRCGQTTTAANFPYNMLTIDEISSTSIPSMREDPPTVRCVTVRPSDGLLLTGDDTCQIIFWRLTTLRRTKLSELLKLPPPEYEDDEDEVVKSLGQGSTVKLLPIRRIASRL